jgi:two-component system nitrate/nitrite response regulator NarL
MSEKRSDQSSTHTVLLTNNLSLFLGLEIVLSPVTSLTHALYNGSVERALQDRPQLIIVDMEYSAQVPALIRQAKQTLRDVKILLLAGFNEMDDTRQALQLDVDGVMLKMQPPQALLAAVTAVMPSSSTTGTATCNGHAWSPPQITAWPDPLSPRERDIVRCVAEGLSNKEVADRLSISAITVRHHLTSIFSKLDVAGRQKLILQVHREGMVTPPPLDSV